MLADSRSTGYPQITNRSPTVGLQIAYVKKLVAFMNVKARLVTVTEICDCDQNCKLLKFKLLPDVIKLKLNL